MFTRVFTGEDLGIGNLRSAEVEQWLYYNTCD